MNTEHRLQGGDKDGHQWTGEWWLRFLDDDRVALDNYSPSDMICLAKTAKGTYVIDVTRVPLDSLPDPEFPEVPGVEYWTCEWHLKFHEDDLEEINECDPQDIECWATTPSGRYFINAIRDVPYPRFMEIDAEIDRLQQAHADISLDALMEQFLPPHTLR